MDVFSVAFFLAGFIPIFVEPTVLVFPRFVRGIWVAGAPRSRPGPMDSAIPQDQWSIIKASNLYFMLQEFTRFVRFRRDPRLKARSLRFHLRNT
jgi:hypothetical protein